MHYYARLDAVPLPQPSLATKVQRQLPALCETTSYSSPNPIHLTSLGRSQLQHKKLYLLLLLAKLVYTMGECAASMLPAKGMRSRVSMSLPLSLQNNHFLAALFSYISTDFPSLNAFCNACCAALDGVTCSSARFCSLFGGISAG